jgi:hypothetical protein
MTARTPPTPFRVDAALAIADDVLSRPPARPHIERPVRRGELVARFALPLELLKAQNAKRYAKPWLITKTRQQIYGMMRIQLCGASFVVPLPGRPQVIARRFSSTEPDAYADGFKQAIDCLCVSRTRTHKGRTIKIPGLGMLRDDRPADAQIIQTWEYVAPGKGFGILEVRA